MDPYGNLIPFGDPSWYQGVSEHPPGLRDVMLTEAVPLAVLQRDTRCSPCGGPRMGRIRDRTIRDRMG